MTVADFRPVGALPSTRFPHMVRVIERGVIFHAIYRIPGARTWRYLLDLDWWTSKAPGRDWRALAEIAQRHGCHHDWWFGSLGGTAKFQTLEAAEAALAEVERRWPATATD